MLVDLHAHYPMHLIPDGSTHDALRRWKTERWRALIIDIASRFANYQGPGNTPSVTVERLREGDVGIALSVLLSPFDEVDAPFNAPPHPGYFDHVLDQLELVEADIATHSAQASVVHTGADLEDCVKQQRLGIVHALEGGYMLGADTAGIERNVAELGSRGVGYVTLAHIFPRGVATVAPAIPSLPDWLFQRLFPQNPNEGLTGLGRDIVRAMHANRILIDITHMSAQSLTDTFELMDELDEQSGTPADARVPLIATHIACRGDQSGPQYNFDDNTIKRVADRGGLLGVIDCRHWITIGRKAPDETFEDSVTLICENIDRIRSVTGTCENIGIGTDLDGYVKPSLAGIEHSGCMRKLQQALIKRYGQDCAEKICSGNALRVLRARFAGT